MKGFDKVKVKEEPIDELPAVNSNSTLASVKPRLSSSNESIKPSLNRDPRLKNLAMNPATSAKRSAFLSSTLKAPELTRTTARSTLNTDEQIKNIQMKTKEMRKLIAEPSTSFYSNIPAAPFAPSRSLESRSPVISNNHSARFISHATSENIHDALEGRNRNISSEVQITAQRVGADLDAISKRIRSQVSDSQTTYTLNTRSITTQTNADTETGVTSVPQTNKIFATVGTQTTKNDGVLTIWNVKDLTDIQRKALLEFKKVNFCFLVDFKS